MNCGFCEGRGKIQYTEGGTWPWVECKFCQGTGQKLSTKVHSVTATLVVPGPDSVRCVEAPETGACFTLTRDGTPDALFIDYKHVGRLLNWPDVKQEYIVEGEGSYVVVQTTLTVRISFGESRIKAVEPDGERID